jgi:hypothetical protein
MASCDVQYESYQSLIFDAMLRTAQTDLEQRPDHEPMEGSQALIVCPRHRGGQLFFLVVHVLPEPETCESEPAVGINNQSDRKGR